MKQAITMNWLKNMAFETSVNGHKIILDASEEGGGENLGPRPKAFMLVALGGCTGMDVVSILKKMRVEYKSLEIVVEGDTADEHPKKFLKMNVIYNFVGENLPLDKIQKAVDLSKDRYCGVYASYKDTIEIQHIINIKNA
ncbi:MAG: OsmC family protein [Bacteroidales bacterium]|nr:OsmC family protein [Bacteroidales bacterium]MCB8999788.1 OsmC family protein [Bacteroidales bacterium]